MAVGVSLLPVSTKGMNIKKRIAANIIKSQVRDHVPVLQDPRKLFSTLA